MSVEFKIDENILKDYKSREKVALIRKILNKIDSLSKKTKNITPEKWGELIYLATKSELKHVDQFFVAAFSFYEEFLNKGKTVNVINIINDVIIMDEQIEYLNGGIAKGSSQFKHFKVIYDAIYQCVSGALAQANEKNVDFTYDFFSAIVKLICTEWCTKLFKIEAPDAVFIMLANGYLYKHGAEINEGKLDFRELIEIIFYWVAFYEKRNNKQKATTQTKKGKTGIIINGKDLGELPEDAVEVEGDSMTIKL